MRHGRVCEGVPRGSAPAWLSGHNAAVRGGRHLRSPRCRTAEDEGAHTDSEPDLVAGDVGIDAGAAGAEEAAVHVEPEDEAEARYN